MPRLAASIVHHLSCAVMVLGGMVLCATGGFAEEPSPGEEIYRQQCAACHGQQGEGTSKVEPRLTGDKSVKLLAEYIDEMMPEEEPDHCTGDDARQVAEYIHAAFYSPLAQARIAPPRIVLSRLTARQHRQVLADLLGGFRAHKEWGEERGLRTGYFNSGRSIRVKTRVVERTEANIDFDLGAGKPDVDKLNQEIYAMRWQGGLLVPETGEYELVLKTRNGVRLWLNDDDQPLIDAWVRSGEHSEYRESMFLIGGRVYPIRVEFFRAKEDKASGLSLRWKRPGRVDEVISTKHLSPWTFPPVFVLQAKFPPDDRSLGYERGTSISRQWDQATTHAATEAAEYVEAHLHDLTNYNKNDPKRAQVLRRFCAEFVERAFRQPLTEEERQALIDPLFDRAATPEEAIQLLVLRTLKSPRFLYLELQQDHPQHAVAARLALGLWDGLPDQPLRAAAAAGELKTPKQVVAHAERMSRDPRGRAKLRQFFHVWLHLSDMHDVAKDTKRFPDFDQAVLSDLRESLDRQLDEVLWSNAADYRQLMLGDKVYLNGRLAKWYGAPLAEDADFQPIRLGEQPRSGVLTHPLLMTGFAHRTESSPIHRGVFLARNVLGRKLRPPQEAFELLSPELHPEMTTRQRVALQTEARACQHCHSMINPLGFALEHFDAVGRFRDKDNDKPVDAAAKYVTAEGRAVEFRNAVDVGRFAAASPEAHDAFIERLFHHLAKQPLRAYGPKTPEELRDKFAKDSYNMRKLWVQMATTAALPIPNR